jgi:ABC-2 type transport system ATP-binding protein
MVKPSDFLSPCGKWAATGGLCGFGGAVNAPVTRMNALSVEGVKKSFRGDLSLARREVLHGVSFEASSGEVLGFLGPNGAGKTTTIKILLGLIKPDSGHVRILDSPAGDPAAMSRVGYLPEMPFFYPHLSLGEFLDFCGRLSGVRGTELPRRIDRVVGLVGLGESRETRLKSFSKGMLQRAGLAQAIIHDPDLLILDEPFSGLDPIGRKMVRDILVDLKARGKTIFFSSHILPDMEALCDRACIIREGVIVKTLALDDLVRLGEGRVEVTARGWKPGMLSGIEAAVESSSERGDEVRLVVRRQQDLRGVIEHLYRAGAEILEVGSAASLEKVFMDEIARPGAAPKEEAAREPEEAVFSGF